MADNVPRHIAFIMDGNGRWARRRALARVRGHERGAGTVRRITEYCAKLGVEEATFFALSTENFKRRPRREVKALMELLRNYLIKERASIVENNLRLRTIGRTEELPEAIQAELRASMEATTDNDGMIVRLALNYGSRQEILDAVARIAQDVGAGVLSPESIASFEEGDFVRYLYDPEMSDPDLLIRTAGEYRMSNFLLWQLSYSELYIVDDTWPDFTVDHLQDAIGAFQTRERKFGSLRRPATSSRDGLA